MEKEEDEFDAYFRRAPVKQLSQQYDPISPAPSTAARQRRASLQAPDLMYSTYATSPGSKRSGGGGSPMTSRNASSSPDPSAGARTPTSPHRHSGRRRAGRTPQCDDVADRQSASPSISRLARHCDQRHSTGSPARRQRRAQLTSNVSSPGTAPTRRSGSRSPPGPGPAGPLAAARKGRRATLAGDLLQLPPSFGDCDDVEARRSSSVSPPSTSRAASPTARRQPRPARRDPGTQPWDRASTFDHREQSSPREGHVIRAFVLSPKGVINVGNTVRGDKVRTPKLCSQLLRFF